MMCDAYVNKILEIQIVLRFMYKRVVYKTFPYHDVIM